MAPLLACPCLVSLWLASRPTCIRIPLLAHSLHVHRRLLPCDCAFVLRNSASFPLGTSNCKASWHATAVQARRASHHPVKCTPAPRKMPARPPGPTMIPIYLGRLPPSGRNPQWKPPPRSSPGASPHHRPTYGAPGQRHAVRSTTQRAAARRSSRPSRRTCNNSWKKSAASTAALSLALRP